MFWQQIMEKYHMWTINPQFTSNLISVCEQMEPVMFFFFTHCKWENKPKSTFFSPGERARLDFPTDKTNCFD